MFGVQAVPWLLLVALRQVGRENQEQEEEKRNLKSRQNVERDFKSCEQGVVIEISIWQPETRGLTVETAPLINGISPNKTESVILNTSNF